MVIDFKCSKLSIPITYNKKKKKMDKQSFINTKVLKEKLQEYISCIACGFPILTLSATDNGKSVVSCEISAILSVANCLEISFKIVLFPLPLSPANAILSPGFTLKLTDRKSVV